MNSFDLNQSQTLLSNAQSDVLRTKYDYIFKIKILEFYFGILSLKLIHYVKKSIYLLIGGAVVVIALLIILSKTGENKDEGKEVETAIVNATTIVETVSATVKFSPKLKISSEVSGEISLPVVEGQVVKKGDLLLR
jgi:multidrug efflux pump subunit AcrA (membrane-fusion protein)